MNLVKTAVFTACLVAPVASQAACRQECAYYDVIFTWQCKSYRQVCDNPNNWYNSDGTAKPDSSSYRNLKTSPNASNTDRADMDAYNQCRNSGLAAYRCKHWVE